MTSDRPIRGPRGPPRNPSASGQPQLSVLLTMAPTKGKRRVQVATDLRCAGFERTSSLFHSPRFTPHTFSFRSCMCWSSASWRTVLSGSEPRGSLCSDTPVGFSSRCLFLPTRSVFRTFVAAGERLARRLSAFLSASPHVAVVDRLEYLAHVHCHPESESPLSCFSLVLSEREEVVDCLVTLSPESCLIWRLELVEMRVAQGGEGLVAQREL